MEFNVQQRASMLTAYLHLRLQTSNKTHSTVDITHFFLKNIFKIYVFIWLCRVLAVALRIFFVAHGLASHGTWA